MQSISFSQYEQEVIDLRRNFHMNPELGFKEFQTAEFIEKYLRDLGIETKRVATTGVVGCIVGDYPGKTVLLRADMDALPVEEQTGLDYASKNPGVMHACGHDGHMAMLLVAAKILSQNKDKLHGIVKLVFQPNEEEDGASYMVKEGVLENPKVDASFAMHIWTPLPSGTVGISTGAVMGEMYIFKIKLTGKGGHSSAPHNAKDPILCAASVIQGLQSIQTREISSLEPTSIVFGKVSGGTVCNIIPDTVHMEGTLRYLYDGDDDKPQHPRIRFIRVVEGICAAHDIECDIQFIPSNYTVINDKDSIGFLTQRVLPQLHPQLKTEAYQCMAGEDFSEFTNRNGIPGALTFIGTGNPDANSTYAHHNAKFNIDEATLITGVQMHVITALEYLAP